MKQTIFILSVILCNVFSAFAQQYPYNYNPPKKELTPAEEQAKADSIAYADEGKEEYILKQIKVLIKEENFTEAVKLMHKVSHVLWVQNRLAIYYNKGQGVPQSYKEAAYWYRKAAEQGSDFGQYFLAGAYKYGEGVPQSYSDAAYWYRKAAEQGDKMAQNDLGILYANGKGVPLSLSDAVFWFRKSAEQGDETAQNNLGIAYEEGKGITQDYWQARYWYRKAAAQGYEKAIENLRRLDAEGR